MVRQAKVAEEHRRAFTCHDNWKEFFGYVQVVNKHKLRAPQVPCSLLMGTWMAWSSTSARSSTDLWQRQRCPCTLGLRTFAPFTKWVSSRTRGTTDPSAWPPFQEMFLSLSSMKGTSTSWRQNASSIRANTAFIKKGVLLKTSLTFLLP